MSNFAHPVSNLAVSINDTARTLNLGRTSVYKLIHDGQLLRIKVGRRTLVRTDSILALLHREG